VIHFDNQSCIKLYENPIFHDRSKHIEIIYHFICEWVRRGVVQLEYIPTDEQIVRHSHEVFSKGKACLLQIQDGSGEEHFPR
jgi:hypothetical protein